MAEYTFFSNPMSRGMIARWALHEVGADYAAVIVEWADKPPALLAANPMGKVPTIIHHALGDDRRDDRVISEAAAICAYLADTHPGAGLAPRETERADYYRWLFFAAGPVEQAITAKAMGWEVPEGRERMAGFGSFDRTVDTLEGALTGRSWICGERFTMADVYVGSAVGWGLALGTMPKREAFTAYSERCEAREACRTAREIDEALQEQAKS